MRVSQLFGGGLLVAAVQAQQTIWEQCGGIGWTGGTTCAAGLVCTYSNAYYSQCLAGTATTLTTSTSSAKTSASSASSSSIKTTVTTSTSTKTTTSTSATATVPAGKFKYLGVDESGAEFGTGSYPGVWGTDFIFPSTTSIDILMGQGFNIFRLPFAMERMAPNGLAAALGTAYLANYTAIVTHITGKGGYAIVDPHNFGRYNGAIITSTSDFQTFWTNLASHYASNSLVIFDTNNEYHDMDQTLVFNLNQVAITGIRSTGATSQYIFVEGNSYSGAWTWVATNTNLVNLTDSSNKIVYEMHQYLDSDGSGTSATCVSTTIGVERVTSATQWLIDNNKVGILGEYAGGANSDCMTAVTGMLSYMEANSNVWLGALWWGGGPWWPADYIYIFEPTSSLGYNYYDTTLITYAP